MKKSVRGSSAEDNGGDATREPATLDPAGPDVLYANATPPAELDIDDETLCKTAVRAISVLAGRQSTPIAEDAAAVAMRALLALAEPADPSHASAVQRMHRALVGADERRERSIIYAVADLVEGASEMRKARGTGAAAAAAAALRDDTPGWLYAKLAERWPDETAALTKSELAGWLASERLATSGVVARILVGMQWWGPAPLAQVTKRVDQAMRARRRRAEQARK